MKIIKLNEMALSRKDAVSRCGDLGDEFIKHFHKCVNETSDSESFHHHCYEMQSFFDKVKFIVLQQNKKVISADNLINWFFTAGSDIEHVIEEPYQDIYESLYLGLLRDRKNSKVYDILKNLM